MNYRAIQSIYKFEMNRAFRTVGQSIISPVISTTLYFVVFGAAMGGEAEYMAGVPYSAFIVPGLMMMTVLTTSVSNASFGIYFPQYSGTIYEILSAPISFVEVLLGYVGAAASKSVIIGLIILLTSTFFVPLEIKYPIYMLGFLILTAITFSMLGFIIGIWADGFEKLQVIPLLVITPLSFLGGSFYSIKILPEFWQKVSMLNPVVYLISGFRWSFYGVAEVNLWVSLGMILAFLTICFFTVAWIFKTGYRLKN